MYGFDLINHIVNSLYEYVNQSFSEKNMQQIFFDSVSSGEFILIFNDGKYKSHDIALRVGILRLKIMTAINNDIIKRIGYKCKIKINYALFLPQKSINLIDELSNVINTIRNQNGFDHTDNFIKLKNEFLNLIKQEKLSPNYQPIVNLSTAEIFGWESLIRCSRPTHFDSPALLFNFAEECGALFSLEEACRYVAIKNIGTLEDGQKLFLNIHPRTLADPEFKSGKTLELLSAFGLKPINVVFEITERHSIEDFRVFYDTLEHYRKQGYLIALDDVGTGYSGLWTIAEVKPDFIKIDMAFVKGLDMDSVKRSLVESLLYFADKIDCRVIAEGIERERELTALISMGVNYGQGFYICRPAISKPIINDEIKNKIFLIKKDRFHMKCSLPIETLVESVSVASETELIKHVKNVLDQEIPLSGVVVLNDKRPVGLIMSYHLDRKLGSQYGVPLYLKRPVTQLMDPEPLIVDADTPIESVAKAAMEREQSKLYDHIIVTKNGVYKGIVSVQNMFDTLARLNLEIARGANPLTGLPGNVAIEQEIEERLGKGTPFSLAYADLDNFKAYNDAYGFKKGDQIILLLARILKWGLKKYGSSRDFIGHIGGDDFVVVMNPEAVEVYCQKVVDAFGRAVSSCFTQEDRKRGYFISKNREGETGQFLMTSVSLAVINCHKTCSLVDIAKKAAELKKYAKTIPGNCWVVDRRGACGVTKVQ